MADISVLARLLNGAMRNVDLTNNTPVVLSIKVGGVTNTELTKAILDKLVALQNGSDVDATYHTHDGRYYTEAELGAQTNGASGASKIGIDVTPAFANFTSGSSVQSALEGIDSALATAGGTSFSDAVFEIKDDGDATKKIAFQASGIATATTRTIAMPDANVSLGDIALNSTKIGNLNTLSGVAANEPDLGAFTGATIADDSTIKAALQALETSLELKESISVVGEIDTNVNDLITLSGVAENATHLGTFSGTTIADSSTVKSAIQSLESAIEGLPTPMQYKGVYNANTDSPALDNADTGKNGWLYQVNVAGSQDFGAGSITFDIGDKVVNNGTIWEKWDMTDAVTSVNSQSGAVTVNAINELTGDVTASAASGSQSKATTIATGAVTGAKIANDTIENVNIKSTAAIAESKLALTYSTSSLNTAIGTKLTANVAITGATKTKITYDVNGLVTAGADATTADIADSSNKRYVTDADLTDIGNLSGVNSGDQTITLTGDVTGSGTGSFAATVVRAPAIQAAAEVAGEAFSATTIYAVRYAQNAETAGRLYKADLDATSTDNFYAIGIMKTVGALSAADPMPNITKFGLVALTAHGFTVGKPVYLSASGALTSTAPSTANYAVVKLGMVKDANTIDVNIQVMGVN
jgi:hypothetical protein